MSDAPRRIVFNMRDDRPAWAPPAWVGKRLRAALPEGFELIEVEAGVSGRGDGGGADPAALEAVRGAEIHLGLGLPRELLLAALAPPSRLRWVHTGTAGVASLLHPELQQHGLVLTNSAGVHGPPMAETVLAMMLHFARGIDHAVAAQRQRTWAAATFERTDSGVREAAGATVGIIGGGGIGREVASRAQALGMNVLMLRRSGGDSLDRILAESHFIVVAVPSTAATRGMIGAAEIQRMRAGAVLVNVARGDIVDEVALATALAEGRLRGAALDVFAVEPLPPTSPLWDLPNVLVMPHVSATSPRFWERELELILDNLHRYCDGLPLRNAVDLSAGY